MFKKIKQKKMEKKLRNGISEVIQLWLYCDFDMEFLAMLYGEICWKILAIMVMICGFQIWCG